MFKLPPGWLRRIVPWLLVALFIALLDQATKVWVESIFVRGERLPVTSFFNLVLVYNRGAAFSFLSDAAGWQRYLLVAIALVAVLLIIGLLAQSSAVGWYRVSLVLILGGAIGNLWDRITVGEVVDFLDFHLAGWHWPAFNVADSAISVGAVLLLWDGFFGAKK
ncbi:MAG: signal peptidase II [Burkholderiales bacterium]